MEVKKKMLDVLGVSSAALCTIHCLLLPFLALIPFSWRHNHWIDLSLALLGLAVVYQLANKERSNKLLFWLWFSIMLVLGSVIVTIFTTYHSQLIYLGSFGLILGHIINYKSSIKSKNF